MNIMPQKIKIYTDGSTRNNGAVNATGAWGFIVVEDEIIIHSCANAVLANATNQRMELMAIINACDWAAERYESFVDIEIISDSAYALNCFKQKWYEKWQMNGWVNSKKEPVANRDLWELLIPYFYKANFNFVKVKGHDTDIYNNKIDALVQRLSAEARELEKLKE